jgi:catechol 2,3-dioxygenase-like lactoylglutathione lyase family enzyme
LLIASISFQRTNYKESVAFYNALLGRKLVRDTGSQNQCPDHGGYDPGAQGNGIDEANEIRDVGWDPDAVQKALLRHRVHRDAIVA